MTFKYFRYPIDFALALLSSSLLVASFPKFDLGFLAWVGLLPLLVTINEKSLKYSFLLSFASGIVFFLGIFSWILVVPKYTLIHHLLLAIYLGSYFGVFGLIFSFISGRSGKTFALFGVPFIWVSLEYIRSNLSFLALPWGLLGHSQYQYPLVVQIASFAGTYSISFLIVMVNCALTVIILPLLYRSEKHALFSNKGRKSFVIATASLVVFTLIYGKLIMSQKVIGKEIKVSVVQGNIEQAKKWDPVYAQEIMQTYARLTQEASKDQPAIIIWPETATPGLITQDPSLHTEVKKIAKETSAYLIIGSAQHQKFKGEGEKRYKYFNSAFLIHPDFQVLRHQRYHKIHLFPFGEYLPYKETLPWSLINVRESGNYAPGKEWTVFNLPESRFAVTICWENIFPDLFRQFVKRGAQFMVNITNEAHFGRTAAPYQLAAISVFRAVENRVFVVRCANTGISCIIDPHGRIVDRVKDGDGQDVFVQGWLNGSVIPLDSKTFYTRYGDWEVWVSVLGTVMFLTIAVIKRFKRR
jgi:apolipoprotein N-acyltransferase